MTTGTKKGTGIGIKVGFGVILAAIIYLLYREYTRGQEAKAVAAAAAAAAAAGTEIAPEGETATPATT